MLRPGLATERRVAVERAPMLRQAQAVAAAEVAAASSAAVVTETVDAAVTGDLVERSPALRAKLEQLDNRLQELEQLQ